MTDKNLNSKTEWIHSVFAVQRITEHVTKDRKVTFITPFGFVVGEECELKEYDFSEEVSIYDQLKDDPTVNPIALVESLYKSKNLDRDFQQEDRRVFLKDVSVYDSNNNGVLKTDSLMLFVDQIIGILPRGINREE